MKYRMMRWHMGFTDGNRTAVYMKALKVFLENREPVKLTLQTIGRLEKVCGQSSQVYVVENPAVFSVLIRSIRSGL